MLLQAGFAFFAGVSVILFYSAVTGFLERRRKIYEMMGDNAFTLKRRIIEILISIRTAVEQINVKFTKNKRYARIEKMLQQLGMSSQYTRESFMLAEEAAAVSGFVIMWLLLGSPAFGLLCGPLFFLLPSLMIKSRVERKKYLIRRSISNGLDIIAAYIEGGMSLPSAVIKYANKSKSVFASELKSAVGQMEVGKGFTEVMKEMEERLETKDISTVVNAFVQAEKTGGSIRKIIQSQADEIRKRHFMALKQQAHEAPVKMLIPMILFIFPVIFIILFGPIVLKLMHGM